MPGEYPEYGAGDPERVLELTPADPVKYGKRWSKENKVHGLGVPDITEITELTREQDQDQLSGHRHTISETSHYSRN